MTANTATTSPTRRFFALPATRQGGWALALDLAFFAFMVVFFALVASDQRGGETFFSNLWLATPILLAGLSAVAAGVVACVAIFLRGEQSIFSFASVLLGGFVLFWIVAELVGHDEPITPAGSLTVEELLDSPVYQEEVAVYGRVDHLGELLCPCFTLEYGEGVFVVWHDLMVAEDGTARPVVQLGDLDDGDYVTIRGELRTPDEATTIQEFWAASISEPD